MVLSRSDEMESTFFREPNPPHNPANMAILPPRQTIEILLVSEADYQSLVDWTTWDTNYHRLEQMDPRVTIFDTGESSLSIVANSLSKGHDQAPTPGANDTIGAKIHN